MTIKSTRLKNKPVPRTKTNFVFQLQIQNQYDIGRRGCPLMSSLLKANWDRQAGKQTDGRVQVSIGMHAHQKIKIKRKKF